MQTTCGTFAYMSPEMLTDNEPSSGYSSKVVRLHYMVISKITLKQENLQIWNRTAGVWDAYSLRCTSSSYLLLSELSCFLSHWQL